MHSDLKSLNVEDINSKPCKSTTSQDKTKDNLFENKNKDYQKKTPLKQSHDSSNSSIKNTNSNEPPTLTIRSALAKRILQSSGKLPKTNTPQTNSKTQHMISVLKNPPNGSQSPSSINNSNESIVTTTNSSNNEVKNIIVQNTQNTLPQQEVKTDPPRRKLGLTEYRKRNNKSKTPPRKKSSIVDYVYHASTMTDFTDLSADVCDREIILVLKDRSEVKEGKKKSKPSTCDSEIQTYETMFESSTNTVMDVVEMKKSEGEKR